MQMFLSLSILHYRYYFFDYFERKFGKASSETMTLPDSLKTSAVHSFAVEVIVQINIGSVQKKMKPHL